VTSAQKKNAPWVWPALLLTLGATAWAALSEEPAEDLAVPRPEKDSRPLLIKAKSDAAPAALPMFTPRAVVQYDPENLFPGDAPPQEAIETAPAKRTTPSLPFTYAGKLVENDQAIVFLQHGQSALSVKAGDVIDGTWRVESVSSSSLLFSYLPLGTVVPLTFGVSN